jgi:hypothetical protein
MITLAAITLPADLEWIDEHAWSPVGQATSASLTGALIVEEASMQAGRPITLQGGENASWMTKGEVEALQTLADTAGLEMTLDYHGQVKTVMFNRESRQPIEARLVQRVGDPQADDYYYITIRLMEI